jgi:hypothetical protein
MVSVDDVLRQRYGAEVYALPPEIKDIPTTPVKVLENDPQRIQYQITNIGTTTLYFSFSPKLTGPADGIPIAPEGGAIISTIDEDFALVTREVFLVSAGAPGKAYITVNRVR